ncbi:MAG: hypothetical protein AAGF85_15410 [Bacteroidota bacterium]
MKIRLFSSLLLLLFLASCSVEKLQQAGTVDPTDFNTKVSFETYKGVISLDFSVDGQVRKFLFDTGADLTVIQRDSISGKTYNVSGASKRKTELGREIVTSMRIGPVDFQNTYAFNGNLSGLKEQIPAFGGLLGQSIIGKANWLIDYPGKYMTISSSNLADNTFKPIRIRRENGNNPYTFLTYDGIEYKVVIDMGSSSVLNLPNDSRFAKDVSQKIKLSENTRDRYTLGGIQMVTEKVGVIPELKLGEFTFKNVDFNINTSSRPRIGIRFFKEYLIYIDNSNGGAYRLKRSSVAKTAP